MPTLTTKEAQRERPKVKVVVRRLRQGVPEEANYNHTSFRLEPNDRRLLRLLAKKRYGGTTMSTVLRLLIRQAAEKEGIK